MHTESTCRYFLQASMYIAKTTKSFSSRANGSCSIQVASYAILGFLGIRTIFPARDTYISCGKRLPTEPITWRQANQSKRNAGGARIRLLRRTFARRIDNQAKDIDIHDHFQESKATANISLSIRAFHVTTRGRGKSKTARLAATGVILQLPEEEIPGLGRYLREHSSEQIINRFHGRSIDRSPATLYIATASVRRLVGVSSCSRLPYRCSSFRTTPNSMSSATL